MSDFIRFIDTPHLDTPFCVAIFSCVGRKGITYDSDNLVEQ